VTGVSVQGRLDHWAKNWPNLYQLLIYDADEISSALILKRWVMNSINCEGIRCLGSQTLALYFRDSIPTGGGYLACSSLKRVLRQILISIRKIIGLTWKEVKNWLERMLARKNHITWRPVLLDSPASILGRNQPMDLNVGYRSKLQEDNARGSD